MSTKNLSASADQIKRVARHLFAQRGVDGVSVRDIARAAGQKNHAAVGYHFGSKEDLVREIVTDGAVIIDERRNAALDQLEQEHSADTISISDIIEILIYSAINLEENKQREDSYIRFVTMLGMTHRALFMEAVDGRWNSGYQRCLDHLRRLMPPMSTRMKNQRFVFMGAYISSVLSTREAALTDTTRKHPQWRSDSTLKHFIATIVALVNTPADKM